MLYAAGQHDAALELAAGLLDTDTVAIAGTPVSLAARFLRCQQLESLKRTGDLAKEALALHRDLLSSRWALTGPVYAIYLKDAEAWLKTPRAAKRPAERLADAVATLWDSRASFPSGRTASPVRRVVSVGGEDFAVLWQPRANDV